MTETKTSFRRRTSTLRWIGLATIFAVGLPFYRPYFRTFVSTDLGVYWEASRRLARDGYSYDEYVRWFCDLADDLWRRPARRWPLERPLYPLADRAAQAYARNMEREKENLEELAAQQSELRLLTECIERVTGPNLGVVKAERARYKARLEAIVNKAPVRAYRAAKRFLKKLLRQEEHGTE